MTITVSSLNTYVQNQSGAALRTFDRTMRFGINAYVRQYGFDNTYGAWMTFNNYTTWGNYYQRFERVNASNSWFNGYYDPEITAGRLIYAQDIVDTIGRCMRRAVDLAESSIGTRQVTVRLCHASCHGSCHTSRGRR